MSGGSNEKADGMLIKDEIKSYQGEEGRGGASKKGRQQRIFT